MLFRQKNKNEEYERLSALVSDIADMAEKLYQ